MKVNLPLLVLGVVVVVLGILEHVTHATKIPYLAAGLWSAGGVLIVVSVLFSILTGKRRAI